MKKWKVKAELLEPWYINCWYDNKRVIYVYAFTQNGAERKALRKLRRRYRCKKCRVVRIRPMKYSWW